MPRILLASVLALAPFAPLSAYFRPAGRAPVQEESFDGWNLEQLLARAEKDGNGTPPALFDAIAKFASRDALRALQRCDRWAEEFWVKRELYQRFVTFNDQPELRNQAAAWLAERCLDAHPDVHFSAAQALAKLTDAAPDAGLRVLRQCKAEHVGPLVLAGLLDDLRARPDDASLLLLLEHFVVGLSGTEEEFLTTFAAFQTLGQLRKISDWILDSEDGHDTKSLALRSIGAREGSAAQRVLVSALDARTELLQVVAIEELMRRQDSTARAAIEAVAKKAAPAVRGAALAARSEFPLKPRAWLERIAELTRDKHPEGRQIAVQAYARIVQWTADEARRQLAVDGLARLLADPDESVRRLALEEALGCRQKALVPHVFALFAGTDRALFERIGEILELLTGVEHGHSQGRWQAWWDAEGAKLELPTLAAAIDSRKERIRTRNRARRTSFYGMEAIHDNLVFVLDASGSMKMLNEWDESRFDVAKQNVEGALKRLPLGTSFNIVFFGNDVIAWQPSLTTLTEESRAAALEFVRDQDYLGGTAIYDALRTVFEDQAIKHIYLLSDGEPSGGTINDPELIADEVAAWNKARGIQIHCISIGYHNRLLAELSEKSGGEFKLAE